MTDQPPAGAVDDSALAALAQIPPPAAPVVDEAPAKTPRKSRSGTSGAERRRRAQAANGDKPPTKAPVKKAPTVSSLESELADRLGFVVELLRLVDGRDAAVIDHNRKKLAHVLASKYPRIATSLVKLLGFGDELDGLLLLGMIAGQIADNHGLLPAQASAAIRVGTMLTGTAPTAAAIAKSAGAKDELAAALGPLVSVMTAGAEQQPADPPAATAAA